MRNNTNTDYLQNVFYITSNIIPQYVNLSSPLMLLSSANVLASSLCSHKIFQHYQLNTASVKEIYHNVFWNFFPCLNNPLDLLYIYGCRVDKNHDLKK